MRSFSFHSTDSMDAVLFPRAATHPLNSRTSSGSIIEDYSSDLDLTDFLQDEHREDQDERRDSRSGTRVSNSSEGSTEGKDKLYSDRSLQLLLEAIDVHAKKVGMQRADFIESIIRTDRRPSSFVQYDSSDGSDSRSSDSSNSVYSFKGLVDEIGRIFQCLGRSNEKSEQMTLQPKYCNSSSTSDHRAESEDLSTSDLISDRPESFCGRKRNGETQTSKRSCVLGASENVVQVMPDIQTYKQCACFSCAHEHVESVNQLYCESNC